MINGVCSILHICDFDISNPLVLILNGDVIIFAGCFEQHMIWYPKILACEFDLRDDGVW
jgi:hypothetical protein